MSSRKKTKMYKVAVFHNLHDGGGLRTLIEICKGLSNKNYIIDIYTLNNKFNNDFKFVNLIKNYSFSLTSIFLLDQIKIFFKLKKIHKTIAEDINKKNYKLAIVHHDIYTKSPYILRYLKLPSIYICHEPPREFYESTKIFSAKIKHKIVNLIRYPIKIVDYNNVKYASLVITNSSYSQKRLQKIYKRNIYKIKLGVDTKLFKYTYLKNRYKKRFFLSVGALAKFKGHDFIIRSISLLPRKIRFPYYIVANNGRDIEYIKKLALEKSVKIVILKNVNDYKLVMLYNCATLFLSGNYYEPFGLATLEALACGCPVIAVNEGGVSEIIDKKTLGCLTVRNVKKFSTQIKKNVLTNNFKREKIHNYVKKRWSWNNTVDELINYMNNLLSDEYRHNKR